MGANRHSVLSSVYMQTERVWQCGVKLEEKKLTSVQAFGIEKVQSATEKKTETKTELREKLSVCGVISSCKMSKVIVRYAVSIAHICYYIGTFKNEQNKFWRHFTARKPLKKN